MYLILLRAVLGPLMVAAAIYFPKPYLFATVLILGIVSDIFDGKIARRLGVASVTIRRLDSVVDTLFYICAGASVWILHPDFIYGNLRLLGILIGVEMVRYLFDWYKFRREASYHMWSAKPWGIVLFICFYSLLVFGKDEGIFALTLGFGILSDFEGLSISLILKEWKNDVPTFIHALKVRKTS